jgi:hypothetical protein
MDGINYSECEMPFKLYSNEISLTQISPKSGSVLGGSDCVVSIDLDPVTAGAIQNLQVGFQPKPKKEKRAHANDEADAPQVYKREMDDWICSPGVYADGKITCKVPQLGQYDIDANMNYHVDVALNGQ